MNLKKEIKTPENVSKRSNLNLGKKHGRGVQIVPNFEPFVKQPVVTFIINYNNWVKCIVRLRYAEYDGSKSTDEAEGFAKLHPDDKWDEDIGKKISFVKAMANLFSLNKTRLFK